eukprot:Em0020g405a
MEVHHKCRLVDLCRVCGCKLHRGVKAKGKAVKPEPSYSCISYADKILVAFDINVAVDAAEIHPQKFCTLCFKAMSRVLVAKEQKNHVKCYVQLYNWHLHSASTCKGCKAFYSTRWHSSPQTIMTEMITPRAIIQVIEKLAPPAVITREPRPLLVASECPCCYTTSDLQPEDLKSAPDLVVKLLSDIAVQCPSCKKDVIARNYNTHKCSPQINTQNMLMEILKKEFDLNDGSFVKGIEESLDAIGVHRQKYFGGILLAIMYIKFCRSGLATIMQDVVSWENKGPSLFTPNLTALGPFIKIFLTPLRDSGACIMQDHYLKVSPRIKSASPPKPTRQKSV